MSDFFVEEPVLKVLIEARKSGKTSDCVPTGPVAKNDSLKRTLWTTNL